MQKKNKDINFWAVTPVRMAYHEYKETAPSSVAAATPVTSHVQDFCGTFLLLFR